MGVQGLAHSCAGLLQRVDVQAAESRRAYVFCCATPLLTHSCLLPAGAEDTVATTGSWQVQPNAVNSGARGARGWGWGRVGEGCNGGMQSGRIVIEPLSFKFFAAVPREALLEVDVRDIDGARRDSVVAAIKAEAAHIAARRRVRAACYSRASQALRLAMPVQQLSWHLSMQD